MLLTLSTTHPPATDLGYLLHKNPSKAQSFALSFGTAHVFYPEASHQRCTAALMIEVDPIGLVRKPRGPEGAGLLDHYVNDRPYAASSFLSVAIAEVFGTALGGRCKERPVLVDTPLPLSAALPVLPCSAGADMLPRLFKPLGYEISTSQLPLDPAFPEWGESSLYAVELTATKPLREVLSHLYVLVPVMDNEKHYWVGEEEVEKLLRHADSWLPAHPERELITRRYLKYRRHLADEALSRLARTEDLALEEPHSGGDAEELDIKEKTPLHDLRLGAVLAVLKSIHARRVLDLGCGEGRLLRLLLKENQFEFIAGMDVSHRAIETARERLRVDAMPSAQKSRLSLFHGSLMYRDARLSGYDAAALVEVIEHLDPPRLATLQRVVFEHARPRAVIVTTPNREYNAIWESLPADTFRHRDHRFEWDRQEFQHWAHATAQQFGYTARLLPVGPEHPALGPPTQMAIFEIQPGE